MKIKKISSLRVSLFKLYEIYLKNTEKFCKAINYVLTLYV